MPSRDAIHDRVKAALIHAGWTITDDPYVISYGERFLFVDLGITGRFIGAERGNYRIAIEIKELRGKSPIAELEQAIGQYMLYQLLLARVDPERRLYLAVTDTVYDELFREPIGELVLQDLPLNLLVVDVETTEVKQWIPPL
ncbi:XisH family protein [Nodosilinea sp. PGN35]|uniref:XisH family protein n=1 Tax=Nodosilinea sp. PGN35 TaxID=3020489 RepID=UPI0023B2C87D|nr:XisH family protein [Nodosilinea sp. TSF1-S3]MDF0366573.1 XisH family protein [Nodosilinea sp. TSF1-S3]